MYFLENSAVLFVALFSEMIALKTEDHSASPLGPRQTCVARCRQIYIKIQFQLKDCMPIMEVTCTIQHFYFSENSVSIII
jgi:hypothetical protein